MENSVQADDRRNADTDVKVGGAFGNHQLQQVRHLVRHGKSLG